MSIISRTPSVMRDLVSCGKHSFTNNHLRIDTGRLVNSINCNASFSEAS